MGVTRCFSYGHIDMTTLIGTAISMGLMLPATTINHQPLRTTILVGIHDLILTTNFFIIMPEI